MSELPEPLRVDEDGRGLFKVHLVADPEVAGVAGESLWAVRVPDGPGEVYELVNTGFYFPLAVGDRVRAQLDGHGRLQIVDVVAAAPRVYAVIVPPEDMQWEEASPILQQWLYAHGTATERAGTMVVASFPAGQGLDEVEALLRREVDAREGWEALVVAGPEHRTRDALEGPVVFELDTTVPLDQSDGYLAAQDPRWAQLGAGDELTLAAIQELASRDPRIAVTARNGRHENILTLLQRLLADDPASLPKLDGPLLDEAPTRD